MRTTFQDKDIRNINSSRFYSAKQVEQKSAGGTTSAKSRKPPVLEDRPVSNSVPQQKPVSSEQKKVKGFKLWTLLSTFIFLAGILVFRKSIVASLIWAGSAVFLGILLSFCAIGFCLCLIWSIQYRRNKKRKSAIISAIFFLISCAIFGISTKYAFNMEAHKPEYAQAIVSGLERNLVPKAEHLVIKFRDGSDWYFESSRLIGPEETNVSEPSFFVLAVIAIEDERFLERLEGVVDFRSVGRVIYRKVKGKIFGKASNEGGSTIQMQIAKNLKNDPNDSEKKQLKERTFGNKIDETIVAQRLDDEFSPDQILSLYANLCDGSYRGMGAVANDLFGMNDLRQLNLQQAALLVAIPKSPAEFNPRTNPKKAKERRDLVLEKMKGLGFISDEQFEKAKNANIEVLEKGWNAEPSFLNAINLGGYK